MIDSMDPVPDVQAVPINGNRFIGHSFEDKEWNEFLWELIGTVIVGTVCHNNRCFVGNPVGVTHQVSPCLGGGVGHVRHNRGIFGKFAVFVKTQSAVDFVCRDIDHSLDLVGTNCVKEHL